MKLFLISPKFSCVAQVGPNIQREFPERHLVLKDRNASVWIVAAPDQSTPASISEQVGIGGDNGNPLGGLVVQIHDYHGYDSKRLWQQLEVWLNEHG